MFQGFAPYDDEGYLLVSLRQYAHGFALYDRLSSEYGPAYFEILTFVFRVLGLDFTHTAGRWFTIVIWLGTGAMCGLAVYRITARLLLAVCTQLLVFNALLRLCVEPPHPGGLLCLTLSAIVLAGSFLDSRPAIAAPVVGALLGIATMIKANVGGFALVSTLFALAAAAHPRRPYVIGAIGAAAVLLPLALMARDIAQPPVAIFAVTASFAIAAIVLVQTKDPAPEETISWRTVIVMLASVALTCLLVCLIQLARGTTMQGLLHGIVLDPVRHPGLFAVSLDLPASLAGWTIASFAAALLYAGVRRRYAAHRWALTTQGIVQLLAGTLFCLAAIGYAL